jgi:hypothetical protein
MQMSKKVWMSLLVMVSVIFTASLGMAEEYTTRNWTATRQPGSDVKPLPAAGRGTDFRLADWSTTPLSIGIFTPVQLPWGENWSVRGLRVSLLYGQCPSLQGVDIGLWNAVEEQMAGVQIGFANTASTMRGIQVGFYNAAYYFKGFQIGAVNYAEGGRGVQVGIVNIITKTTLGWCPLIYGSF